VPSRLRGKKNSHKKKEVLPQASLLSFPTTLKRKNLALINSGFNPQGLHILCAFASSWRKKSSQKERTLAAGKFTIFSNNVETHELGTY
jgi:hypothetical protein